MIELTLPAMSCSHCERSVTNAVKRVDAVAKVQVDLSTKRVRIESALPAESFKAALADEGYPPQPDA
jgi:copper chaperone